MTIHDESYKNLSPLLNILLFSYGNMDFLIKIYHLCTCNYRRKLTNKSTSTTNLDIISMPLSYNVPDLTQSENTTHKDKK